MEPAAVSVTVEDDDDGDDGPTVLAAPPKKKKAKAVKIVEEPYLPCLVVRRMLDPGEGIRYPTDSYSTEISWRLEHCMEYLERVMDQPDPKYRADADYRRRVLDAFKRFVQDAERYPEAKKEARSRVLTKRELRQLREELKYDEFIEGMSSDSETSSEEMDSVYYSEA